MQRALARQAAIEKQLSRYITLECGHKQPIEVANLYRFDVPRGKAFCEYCEKIVPIERPKRSPVPRGEPLF